MDGMQPIEAKLTLTQTSHCRPRKGGQMDRQTDWPKTISPDLSMQGHKKIALPLVFTKTNYLQECSLSYASRFSKFGGRTSDWLNLMVY